MMRKFASSAAVITAASALLVGGGAYSTFTDSQTTAGSFTTGTVKMAAAQGVPGVDVFAINGACTQSYTDSTHPSDYLNLGTVNNLGCTSTFTVHNSGSLPFELSASSLIDSNPAGLVCFTTTINDDGFNKQDVVLPGADRHLSVKTVTGSDSKLCQNVTDNVTVHLTATETRPSTLVEASNDGYFTVGSTLTNPIDRNHPLLYSVTHYSSSVTKLRLTMSDGSLTEVGTGDAPIANHLTQGWWSDQIGHQRDLTDYFVGSHSSNAGEMTLRDFFSFPTTKIHGHVTAASIVIVNSGEEHAGGGTENFWSVHTPAAVLKADSTNKPNADVFNDLGDGFSYGNQVVTAGIGSVIVPLNANAFAAINSLTGW